MATVLHPRSPRAFLAATVVTTLLALMAPLADLAPDVAGPGWQEQAEGHVDELGPLSAEPT
jgi:hypothetical protein